MSARWRVLLPLLIAGILAVLVPLAHSEPRDPTWVAGLYDGADLDDAIWLITSTLGIADVRPPAGRSSILVVLALLPWLNDAADIVLVLPRLRPRAPPAT